MTNNKQQTTITIPAPLLGSEENSFAYYTFTNRLPIIIEQVIAANNFSPAILEKLNKLKAGLLVELVHPIDDQGPDITDWKDYLQPFLGKPLIELPFYFAEVYLYRRLLAITEYFASPTAEAIDPFESQKRHSLAKAITSIRQVSIKLENFLTLSAERNEQWQAALRHLLYLNLWGNRMDLSFAPKEVGKLEQQVLDPKLKQSQIILDDTGLIVNKISSFYHKRIDFIVDNSGFELVSDLFVIDFLLTSDAAEVVCLHLKSHPIFVSDAMIKDVHYTLNFLANDKDATVKALGMRLQKYLASGRLILTDHLFWTAPLFFRDMPEALQQELSQSDLVFIKGDANYRRLVGDYHWPQNSDFQNIVSYFPSALAVLRTIKSEVMVGLQQRQIDDLNHRDSHWLTNGKWGLIQFRW